MEYSNEFLARVYGAYMPCKCLFQPYLKTNDGTDSERTVWGDALYVKLGLVGVQGYDLQGFKWANIYECGLSEVKLLLTPLSAITDEDAVEVAKICGYNNALDNGRWLAEAMRIGKKISVSIDLFICVIDYLRSRGYDCGYAEIPSLIDAGLAIDKTTLNN